MKIICCNLALIMLFSRKDVIMTLMFFNNLRLEHRILFQFENVQFYLAALYVLTHREKTKRFGNCRVFILSVTAFLC